MHKKGANTKEKGPQYSRAKVKQKTTGKPTVTAPRGDKQIGQKRKKEARSVKLGQGLMDMM